MDISLFLSKVLGLYLVILSVGFLINARNIKPILVDCLNNPPLLFVCGVLALVIGTLIVVSHNVWTLDWRVVITIIGWLSVIKGTIRVVIPQFVGPLDKKWILSTRAYYVTFILTFALGVYLCYEGALYDQFLVHHSQS